MKNDLSLRTLRKDLRSPGVIPAIVVALSVIGTLAILLKAALMGVI